MGDTKSIMFLEKRTRVLDRQYHDSTAVLTVEIGRRQVDHLLTLGGGGRIQIDGMPPHEAIQTIWRVERPAPPVRVPPHERHVGTT
jgi:hypothetical protein